MMTSPSVPSVQTSQLVREETARLLAVFERARAIRMDTDILQPAKILLDLYGEDIRARAYTTHDPAHGEQMLRPDFTVPIALHHMGKACDISRYTYAGKVFRRQNANSTKANEYMQAGFEVFETTDPIHLDAEVFTLFNTALDGLGLHAVMGDIGLLIAAVNGLPINDRRASALRRHVWRPSRFLDLLSRFSQQCDVETIQTSAPQIGLRTQKDVQTRIGNLKRDAHDAPLEQAYVDSIKRLLSIKAPAPQAFEHLRALQKQLPAISEATDRLELRLSILNTMGICTNKILFDVSYGRTLMEYYDGFVFGFLSPDKTHPPVATGGRYDALTHILHQSAHQNGYLSPYDNTSGVNAVNTPAGGAGDGVGDHTHAQHQNRTTMSAVGGAIRPEVVVAIKQGAKNA